MPMPVGHETLIFEPFYDFGIHDMEIPNAAEVFFVLPSSTPRKVNFTPTS